MTVEEWLGKDNQLGIDIWEKKYRQSGESFDEWLDRVSGGNSELKELIVSKKFLFGGRILSNRGVDNREAKVTLSNCFVRGTKVYTQNGYKNIESIKKGDLVLTHQNRFKPVNAIMNRVYSGAMQVITGYNFRKIICTANHKFLTENGWVEAKDINKDSYIKVASLKYEHENKKENLLNYIALSNNRFFEEIDGRVRIGTSFIGGNNAKGNKYGEWINKEVTINDDLIYVIGRWLGDGSITNRKCNANNSIFQIVFNENEEQQMLRCKTILENNFGITMCLSANHDQHTLILRCDNEILCEFFYRKFGKYCDGKRISEDLLPNMNWVIGLLDADGLVTDSGQIRLCLKNKRLLEQVKECLMLNNIVTTDVKKIVNNKTFFAYKIEIFKNMSVELRGKLSKKYADDRMNIVAGNDTKFKYINNELYLRVSGNMQFTTDEIGQTIQVFNISVEDDNSYVVNDIVAHNCYVIDPPRDNIESIFDCAKKLARTYSYGGGCGVDISNLAPRGAKVNNAAKTTTGSTSFMDLYSLVTGLIGQNNRRGALMLSISCDHPDLEEFIGIKSDLNRITKANISIRITDKFMLAVKNKQPFTLEFTRQETGETITKEIDAYSFFHKICEMNWDYAEPGMLFWDRIENWNLLSCDDDFHYAGTNPLAI